MERYECNGKARALNLCKVEFMLNTMHLLCTTFHHYAHYALLCDRPEGYPDEEQNEQVKTVFKQHAAAAKATQAADGR